MYVGIYYGAVDLSYYKAFPLPPPPTPSDKIFIILLILYYLINNTYQI